MLFFVPLGKKMLPFSTPMVGCGSCPAEQALHGHGPVKGSLCESKQCVELEGENVLACWLPLAFATGIT